VKSAARTGSSPPSSPNSPAAARSRISHPLRGNPPRPAMPPLSGLPALAAVGSLARSPPASKKPGWFCRPERAGGNSGSVSGFWVGSSPGASAAGGHRARNGSRLSLAASLEDKGNLQVLGRATLDFRPGFRYVIASVSRKGVKTMNGKTVRSARRSRADSTARNGPPLPAKRDRDTDAWSEDPPEAVGPAVELWQDSCHLEVHPPGVPTG
jgi:hypothetical protein